MNFGYRLFAISIFALFCVCGCGSANLSSQTDVAKTNQSDAEFETAHEKYLTEPLNITGEFPPALREKWQKFIANGQYRLAQFSDMKFSEAAKRELLGQGDASLRLYVYAWGDLNYPKRLEDDHLAAIVIDTNKNDSKKFSLVIFSPVKDKKTEYEINWLYREQDLSTFTVNRASGDLSVAQYLDNGSRKACFVKWNSKLKRFNCDW